MTPGVPEASLADGSPPGGLSPSERAALLRLAREAVVAAAAHAPAPVLSADQATGGLVEPRACFVTLRQGKDLRGCIGQLVAREPLWEAVVKNAEGAAIRDYRFPPVTPAEVETLRVEISVLSETVPVDFDTPGVLLAQLVPGVDGVVLRIGGCVSTFLPQVWEDLPDRERFMNHLARKAGLADEAWREAGVRVERYQVHHFEDP